MAETTFTLTHCSLTAKFRCRRTRGAKTVCATETEVFRLTNSVYALRGQNARQKILVRYRDDAHRHGILADALR